MTAENNPTDKTVQNSTEHLKPYQFKPGESGNVNGRPKNAFTIKNAIGRLADSIPEESDKSRADLLAELSWKKALAGDRWFIQYVTENKEGKPHQSQSIVTQETDELIEI